MTNKNNSRGKGGRYERLRWTIKDIKVKILDIEEKCYCLRQLILSMEEELNEVKVDK